jgi:neutral amino acid transport system ATP-binding protein
VSSPPEGARAAILEVEGLRRSFGGVQAVRGVSFAVAEGTITGLIGPNGAGKSTVLAMIAGSTSPSAGSITFRGQDISGKPPHRIARLGVIRTFQSSSEFERLTVLENMLVAAGSQRGERMGNALLGRWRWRSEEEEMVERARVLLERFEIPAKEDELAGNLSGGQKRLLELARSLMSEPQLLLLDEPMAGVNPSLVRRLEEHLLGLRAEGLTMLMVEHELGVVERLCDPVVVMAQGQVLSTGTMSELRSDQQVLDAYLVG